MNQGLVGAGRVLLERRDGLRVVAGRDEIGEQDPPAGARGVEADAVQAGRNRRVMTRRATKGPATNCSAQSLSRQWMTRTDVTSPNAS
jgi:hypothetical protein